MYIKFLLLIIFQFYLFAQIPQSVKIGVLAKRGDEVALNKWQETAKYLESQIKDYNFEILPLSFEKIDLAIRKNEINFLITNPVFYIQLEHKYNISRIATLLNKYDDKNFVSYYGGVIFTKSSSNINTIKDLKNRSFAAVDSNSFGGWIMANKLLHDMGIKPLKFFSKIEYLGTHDRVVKAVLNGEITAGTVRSDTLERMAKEKKINLNDLFILHKIESSNFPFSISTSLYPE